MNRRVRLAHWHLSLALSVACATIASPALAATRYVSTTGTDAGDCSSSSSPCRTVQFAIDVATAGDEVRVASGTYTDLRRRVQVVGAYGSVAFEVAVVAKNLTLRGGYAPGNWATSDPVANPTTLDAGYRHSFVAATGTFQVGEIVTGGTSGATATVLGIAGPRMRLAVTSGSFQAKETITGSTSGATAKLVEAFFTEGQVGTFAAGETVAGGTSGATGQLVEAAGTRLTLNPVSGTFQVDETLTGGTSGATATLKAKTMTPQGRVMSVIGAVTVTLDGLRLAHGLATGLASQWVWSAAEGSNSCVAASGYGEAGSGGGLCIGGAAVTVTAATITENTASNSNQQHGFGAGIYVGGGGRLTISRSTLSNNNGNTAWWGHGNAIALWGTTSFDIDTVTFTDNRGGTPTQGAANEGSALWAGAGARGVLRRCQMTGNGLYPGTPDTPGAVVNVGGAGPYRILENRIENNRGRAIGWQGGSGVSSNATVAGNIVRGNDGGGISAGYLARGSVDNNVIIGNGVADTEGAGLSVYNSRVSTLSPLLVRHNTISNNVGVSGVQMRNSTVDFLDNIVAGHAVGFAVSQLTGNFRLTLRNTLWDGNTTDVEGPVSERLLDVTGPAAFAADGYHLTAASKAVDAGLPAGVGTDYDGEIRFVGVAPDIGADESPFVSQATGSRPALDLVASKPRWPSYANCVQRPCFTLDYYLKFTNGGDSPQTVNSYFVRQTIDPKLAIAEDLHFPPLTYSAVSNVHRWDSTAALAPGDWGWIWLQTASNTVAGGDTLVNSAEFAPEGGSTVTQANSTTWPLEPPVIDWPVNGEMCDGEITVQGRSQPGVTIQLFENESTMVRTTTADAEGDWSITYTSTRIGIDDLTDLSAKTRSGTTTSRPSSSVILRKPSSFFCPQRSSWSMRGRSGWFVDPVGEASSAGVRLWMPPSVDFPTGAASVHVCKCENGATPTDVSLEIRGEVYAAKSHSSSRWDFEFPTPMSLSSELRFRANCGSSSETEESPAGMVLIDPDGYVFDSTKGFDPANPTQHVVPGSKVTCMSYVPETSTWTQWPAAIYNNQVNPQTVGADGYFAFFTPPGLYYLLVEPPSGFQPWRSPVVEVISEIVHVNVPLTPSVFTGAPRVAVTPSGIQPSTLPVAAGSAVEWFATVDAATSAAQIAALAETPATQVKSTLDPLADTKGFDSGKLAPGVSWFRTFTTAGTYTYTDGNGHTGTITVAAAPAPTLTSIDPVTGSAAGGTRVTLTGSGFLDGASVFFGGLAATSVARVSATTLQATTPPHVAGAVDVSVTNPDVQTATLPGAFTYVGTGTSLTLTNVAPASGPIAGGTVVRLTGTGFATGMTVSFGGAAATSVTVIDPTAADAVAPAHAVGAVNVVVTAADAQTATLTGGFTYVDKYRTYLAEGATGSLFLTRVALANPASQATSALLTFLKADGTSATTSINVPATGRATVDVETVPGMATAEFATTVESDLPLIVDRTMRWSTTGHYGSHAERSVPAPATTWYLAEGATHSGFDLFYLLQNPTTTAADVTVTYLLPSGAPLQKTYVVPAQSRFNIWVNAEQVPEGSGQRPLAATDVSAVITSTNGVPIIVERAMYLTRGGQLFAAGHESAGVTSPATSWFLAEGATGSYFDLFVLIANPNAGEAAITANFLLESGAVVTKNYSVAGNSRFNIWVDFEDPALANAAVSTTVTSTNGVPVIVERAMWWPGDFGSWVEAHNSPGSTVTGTRWGLAEGEVGSEAVADNVETYILIANTSSFAGQATVTLLFEDGTTAAQTVSLAANSRTNVPVRDVFGAAVANKRFGALIASVPVGANPAAQLAVERAMYADGGGHWTAGTNALATKLP